MLAAGQARCAPAPCNVIRSFNVGKTNLLKAAAGLPDAWSSTVVGLAGRSQLKVLRMDGGAYPAEAHDFNEALLVLEGVMHLDVGGTVVPVAAGEVYFVPAGLPHAVAQGSHGTLVIIDEPG